ncbi:MAG: hypothetical protein U0401_16460 [Anaerolineae bacterium]
MIDHLLSPFISDRGSKTGDRPSSFLLSSFFFLLIILIAAFLRFHHLPSLPPGLNFDEAGSGVAALEILGGAPKIWWRLGGGQEPFWPYLTALTTALWGNIPLSLRLPAAFVGILTVAATYRLVLTLFAGYGSNRYVLALLTALGLALSDWHLHFSRLGFRAILLPLFAALAFHFFWQAVNGQKSEVSGQKSEVSGQWSGANSQKNRVSSLTLAAFFTALAVYSYLAARLLPFIPVIFLALRLLIHRRLTTLTKPKSYPLPPPTTYFLLPTPDSSLPLPSSSTLPSTPPILWPVPPPSRFSIRNGITATCGARFGTLSSSPWEPSSALARRQPPGQPARSTRPSPPPHPFF